MIAVITLMPSACQSKAAGRQIVLADNFISSWIKVPSVRGIVCEREGI